MKSMKVIKEYLKVIKRTKQNKRDLNTMAFRTTVNKITKKPNYDSIRAMEKLKKDNPNIVFPSDKPSNYVMDAETKKWLKSVNAWVSKTNPDISK